MSFTKEVWDTLSAIDVSDRVQKKNGLSYLSWAWAWGELMKVYPDSDYEFESKVMENDTVMAYCHLTITNDEGKSKKRTMWLPVMDYKNKAIPKPTARDVSDTYMRCLVKVMAMFGLGHYIYAGEDIPDPEQVQKALQTEYQEIADEIKNGITCDDNLKIIEEWEPLSDAQKSDMWTAISKGGFFTQAEKDRIREAVASTRQQE